MAKLTGIFDHKVFFARVRVFYLHHRKLAAAGGGCAAVGSYTFGDLRSSREVNNEELKLTALLSPDKSLTL